MGQIVNRIVVSGRVPPYKKRVFFALSSGLVRRLGLEPGPVAISVEPDGFVVDTAPPEDASTHALYWDGKPGHTLAFSVAKESLPRFSSFRWVNPVIEGKRIFLPMHVARCRQVGSPARTRRVSAEAASGARMTQEEKV